MQRDGFSVDAAIEKGRELPEWYLDIVELDRGEEWFLAAFNDLSSCRDTGFGLGEIPWTAKMQYAEYYLSDLEPELVDALLYLTRRMDNAFLKWHHDNPPKTG